jgi:protein gp37
MPLVPTAFDSATSRHLSLADAKDGSLSLKRREVGVSLVVYVSAELRQLCRQYGTAFFFKQWGGVNKKAAGRVLEGRT